MKKNTTKTINRDEKKLINLKIATLPLVKVKQPMMFSRVERDICGYGFVPVLELFEGKFGREMFVPFSRVPSEIEIQSKETISDLVWSTCLESEFKVNIVEQCVTSNSLTRIHDKLLKDLYNFIRSQEIVDRQISIVCVIYKTVIKNTAFFDMQLGVTGKIEETSKNDVYESPQRAAVREIYEETSLTSAWQWNNILSSAKNGFHWFGILTACGKWTHSCVSAWCIGCTCDQEIRRAGFECCSSGWGSCTRAKEAYILANESF